MNASIRILTMALAMAESNAKLVTKPYPQYDADLSQHMAELRWGLKHLAACKAREYVEDSHAQKD